MNIWPRRPSPDQALNFVRVTTPYLEGWDFSRQLRGDPHAYRPKAVSRPEGEIQDHLCGGDVAIAVTAARAGMPAQRQRLRRHRAAGRARLRRARGFDQPILTLAGDPVLQGGELSP